MIRIFLSFALCAAFAADASSLTFPANHRTRPKVVSAHDATDVCANFAGNWSGTCTSSSGQVMPVPTFSITQDHCATVMIQADDINAFIFVGGLATDSISLPGGSGTATADMESSSWDKTQQILSVSWTNNSRNLAIDDPGQSSSSTETWQLTADKKLQVAINSHGAQGDTTTNCSYDPK